MNDDNVTINSSGQDSPQNTLLLEMKNVRIEGCDDSGKWTPIIYGIDLSLRRGEILGLIGESGAGKSTLGLAAMGYARDGCKISRGEIIFDKENLLRCSEGQRRKMRGARIAYVAQSAAAAFNPAHRLLNQCCETVVLSQLQSRADAEKNMMDMYRQLRMPSPNEIGFRYPHQVSGGQLQRAMTAMAMASRPDLIIFDEPTTALDVTTQIEVLAVIRDIVRSHHTAALYITHDLAVVAQMADSIMVLKNGELVEQSSTRAMLSSPQEEYTQSLWSVRKIEKKSKPLTQTSPLIQVDEVCAQYGDEKVLFDVSFSLYSGRTLAVVGESGSGKSTMARCLTGLLPSRSGQIIKEGQTLPARHRVRSRRQLQDIQMIYQSPDTAINPRQRIRDIIGRPLMFYLGLSGTALKSRINELLEQIELPAQQYFNRFPSELSGGQKQRVCIARALAASPQVIICDEVTSALDQLVAEGILRLLQRLQDELSLSYFFITHDLSVVRAIADDVMVMKEGRVIEIGGKDEIFTPPYHDYTELLLSSVPDMNPDWLDKVLAKRALINS